MSILRYIDGTPVLVDDVVETIMYKENGIVINDKGYIKVNNYGNIPNYGIIKNIHNISRLVKRDGRDYEYSIPLKDYLDSKINNANADITKDLVNILNEDNSYYDSINDATVKKLKIILKMLKMDHDETCTVIDKISNLIDNPKEIDKYFI